MDAITYMKLAISLILDNLRLWMGGYLAPFSLDGESNISLTMWIAVVGISVLFSCAELARKSYNSIRSMRSFVPHAVPGPFNSVGGALGAVWFVRHWIATTYYGSSVYGVYRKVVDWIFPADPGVMILRMMMMCILGPILYSTVVTPYMYLKGLIAGFNAVRQFVPLKCRRLDNIYNTIGRYQTRDERRAHYLCIGERHGFELQDLFEEIEDHPCLNGDIFHLAALTVAAVLLVVFWLGIYIQAVASTQASQSQGVADGRDGTVESNGSVTVPQDEPGHVQEEQEQILDNAAPPGRYPEPKVDTPPAKGQLEASRETDTGVRVVSERDPRRLDAAALEASSVKRENDQLLQKLKQTEEQLTRESTTRSLVQDRLDSLRKFAGLLVGQENLYLLREFDSFERQCREVSFDNITQKQLADLKRNCSEFPKLIQRATIMTSMSKDKKNQERIAQDKVREELERKLESTSMDLQSLKAKLQDRPDPQPLPDPATYAKAELDATRQQYQSYIDALQAQYTDHTVDCSSKIQKLEAELREAQRVADAATATEVDALHKAIGDKNQETAVLNQRILELEREFIDKERQLTNSREQADQLRRDVQEASRQFFDGLSAQAHANSRALGAEATVTSLQKDYDAVTSQNAHLQGLLETARQERDAEAQRCLQQKQVADQNLIQLENASRAREAEYEQRISSLMAEGEKLQEETKKLRKKPQPGTPPELADARVENILLQSEMETLKDQLRQVQTTSVADDPKQLVEDLRTKVQELEKEKSELQIHWSTKVKSLEEDLRKKTIAQSNAKALSGPLRKR